ncbi:MAG: hypothetical protein K8E24_013965, partial [Methanobacterium paludis]|nr:hypothetical protein [Methanobacterium paludis]
MWRNIKIQKKVRISFVIILLAFVGTSVLSFIDFSRLIQLNDDNKKSYTIISQFNDIGQIKRNV